MCLALTIAQIMNLLLAVYMNLHPEGIGLVFFKVLILD